MNAIVLMFLAIWPLLINVNVIDFGQGIPKVDVFRLSAMLLVPIVLFYRLMTAQAPQFNRTLGLAALLIAYFAMSLVVRPPGLKVATALGGFFDLYTVPLAMYFVLLNIKLRNPKNLVYAFLTSGLLSAAIGIAEFVARQNLIGPPSMLDNMAYLSTKLYRTNGPFYDIIGYSSIVLLYIPFCYYFFKEKLISPLIGNMSLTILSVGCLASLSRAPAMAFLLIALILLSKLDFKRILKMSFLCTGLILVCYVASGAIFSSTLFTERVSDNTVVVGRFHQYLQCLGIFSSAPILGIGFGQYLEHFHIQIHNSYLRALVEFGIVGFTIYMVFLFSLLFRNMAKIRSLGNQKLLKARLCVAIIALFVANTIDLLNQPHFMFALMMVIFVLDVDYIGASLNGKLKTGRMGR